MSHASCNHKVYKLSCEQYDRLIARAAGLCEACLVPCRRPVLDHDHALGDMAVRGLVCRGCNVQLRLVDEGRSPGEAIARYLANAYFLTLDDFKVYKGPGIHPAVAAKFPAVQEALRRYVRRCERQAAGDHEGL